MPANAPTWNYPGAPANANVGIYAYTSAATPGRAGPYTPPPPPNHQPTVVAQSVVCHFARSNFTLQVPDLRIFPGEITYIGGESGSGKTTLLRMLTLEMQPDGGNIYMMGYNVAALTPDQRDDFRGGGITYIPQNHLGLVDSVTPVETIARLLYDYDGIDLAEGERRAEIALTRARLPRERFRVRVKGLSGGERARVAIAKAYAAERPLCLADEILAALDERNRIAVLDLFQDLAQEGYTVIVVAHQPEMMNRFHRVIEMEHGHIIGDKRYTPVVRG
ncbi:MAG TPA: ATP-binding cassette domain-containing protein [Ktedonobacterales bacterium]|nr:ATP-binding cassette domain-containing protein [Ktedonobacterales bacterium]